MVPGWPYSVVAALETGRSPGPPLWISGGSRRETTTPDQLRRVVTELITAGHRAAW